MTIVVNHSGALIPLHVVIAQHNDIFDWIRREHAQTLVWIMQTLGFDAQMHENIDASLSTLDGLIHFLGLSPFQRGILHQLPSALAERCMVERNPDDASGRQQGSELQKNISHVRTTKWIQKGVDIAEWNPITDRWLPTHYSAETIERKEQLQMSFLKEAFSGKPVVAGILNDWDKEAPHVSRWIDGLKQAGFQVVLVRGEDDEACHRLRHQQLGMADIWLHGSVTTFDAHALKLAIRYGCLPVIAGQTPDTFTDMLEDLTGGSVVSCADESGIHAAIDVLHHLVVDRHALRAVQARLMDIDVSWNRSRQLYRLLYGHVLANS